MKDGQEKALELLHEASLKLLRVAFKAHEVQYDEVSKIIRGFLGAEHCAIFEVVTPGHREAPHAFGFGLRLKGEDRKPKKAGSLYIPIPRKPSPKCGLLAWIAYHNELFHKGGRDLRRHPAVAGRPPGHLRSGRCEALLAIPLLDRRQNLLGMVKIENKVDGFGTPQETTFSKAEVLFAQVLAAQLAFVLDNKRYIYLFRELIDGLSTTDTSYLKSYELVVDQAKRLFLANRADLCIFDPTQDQLVKVAVSESDYVFPSVLYKDVRAHPATADAFPIKCVVPKDSFIWSVWQRREKSAPYRVEAIDPKRPPRNYRIADDRTRSELAVVLFEATGGPNGPHSKPFGILNLESFRPHYFRRDDVKMLQRFAPYAAVVSQYSHIMRTERDYLQDLLHNMAEGVCRTTEDGKYLLVNRAMKEIYGYPSEAALKAQNAGALYRSGADREGLLRELKEADGRVEGFQFQAWKGAPQDPKRRPIWVRQNVRVTTMDGLFPQKVLDATLVDVTEQRAILERIIASAISTESLHNTISPANRILVEADELRKELQQGGNGVTARLRKIEGFAQRIMETGNQVRRFLYEELGDYEDVDIAEVLRNIAGEWEEDFAQAALKLQLTTPKHAYVKGYSGMLEMFFRNLLQNCVRYVGNGAGTQASLSLSAPDEGATPGPLIIRCEDDGPGFPSECLHNPYTWRPARRDNGQGLGIGLASMCGIIKTLHNGEFEFGNRPDGARGALITAKLCSTKPNHAK